MSKRTSFELNYARLESLLGRPLQSLREGDCLRLRAESFMDLVVEVLPPCDATGALIVSLTHYYEQRGDLCADPEMTVRLFPPSSSAHRVLVPSSDLSLGRAEALSFQQSNPPVYQEVYFHPDVYRRLLHADLNAFLGHWLRNLTAQGHRPLEVRADQPGRR